MDTPNSLLPQSSGYTFLKDISIDIYKSITIIIL